MSKSNGDGAVQAPPITGRRPAFGKKPTEQEAPERRMLVMHPMKLETMRVKVRGLTSVIVHKMSEKGKRQLLENQMVDPAKPGKKVQREKRDPFADFVGSLYPLPGKSFPTKTMKIGESLPFMKDTFGVPAIGFKKGMVFAAARYGMNRIDTEAAVWVIGDLVPLTYSRLIFREDVVKIGAWNARKTDLRYRGEFTEWEAEFMVEYDADLISPETIINLVNRAGRVAGLCEWRPNSKENPGVFGRYEAVLGARK